MGIRSFTVSAARPTFTKRAIELKTISLINELGMRTERRDIAAEALEVTRKTVDAWCAAADPRIISPENLLELAVEATLRQVPMNPSMAVYRVVDGYGEIIAAFDRVDYAAFVTDLRGHALVHREGRSIQMTEQQELRSRLRRIIASGIMTMRQLTEIIGGDEYGLVDRVIELRRGQPATLYGSRIDRLDSVIRDDFGVAAWMGEAA